MSELATARAIRAAAQSLSIAIFCAAITASILLPIVSVVVFKAALKWQMESIAAEFEANRSR